MENKDHLSFGQRYGYESMEIPFQLNEMNLQLRIELWNVFYSLIYQEIEQAQSDKDYYY